jgi:hypothetical protein
MSISRNQNAGQHSSIKNGNESFGTVEKFKYSGKP